MKKIAISTFVGAALASNVNVAGLLGDSLSTVEQVHNGHVTIGDIINDGTKIYSDITGKPVFQLGGLVDAGVKIAEAGDSNPSANNEFLNIGGLINDGVQTIGDIKKGGDLGDLVNDGTSIFNDATGKNIPKEGSNVDTVVKDFGGDTKTGDYVKSQDTQSNNEFVNIAGLINDGVQTIGDIKNGGDIGSLINDGTSIVNDSTGKNIPKLGTDVDSVIKAFGGKTNLKNIIGKTSAPSAESNNEFLNIGGLINDGVQTIGDIKKGGDLGDLINDGTSIYNDATGKNVPKVGGAVDTGAKDLGVNTSVNDLVNAAKKAIGSENSNSEFVITRRFRGAF